MLAHKTFDVVVVGAGPAGATAARVAAEHCARVLLVEEHTKIGRPIQCTGLLSLRGVRESGADSDVLVRPIRRARFYAPDGRMMRVGNSEVRAHVIDRDRLDQSLVKRAVDAGVELREGWRFIKLERTNKEAKCHLRSLGAATNGLETVNCAVVIGADGPHSVVAAQAGLPRPRKTILGIQAVVPYQPKEPDCVEVFAGHQLAPNFFAWAVPAHNGSARVGLGTDDWKAARRCLEKLLGLLGSSREAVLEYQSGIIPLGPAAQTEADRVMLVGDAAGQAKPTSGGGIYTSIACAKIAGEVAARGALAHHTTVDALADYGRRWRALFGRELEFGLWAHQILCRLHDAQINRICEVLDDPDILALATDHGDIDYVSALAREVLKRPRLWGRLIKLLPEAAQLAAALP